MSKIIGCDEGGYYTDNGYVYWDIISPKYVKGRRLRQLEG